MIVLPAFADFATTYDAGKPQVVWASFVNDLETPVSTMLKLADNRKYSFLLESVEGGENLGRYSLIGLRPDLIWRCCGAVCEINRHALIDDYRFEPQDEAPLESIRALLEACRIDLPESLPPMAAGLFGYLGYDMVRLIERLPDSNPDTLGVPDAVLLRPTVMVIFDNVKGVVTVVTPVWPTAGVLTSSAWELASARLNDVLADLERSLPYRRVGAMSPVAPGLIQTTPQTTPQQPVSNTSRAGYHAMVEKAKEYIKAGDVFQVVPSQRFALPFTLPPFALYRSLRRLNPSPFLFYLNFDGFTLVGSSPEILVRLRDGRVTIRPIAGTRRRGADRTEDKALAEDLLADPKELAEHLMLLDLGRNDVGRVARVGTVKVTEQFAIELYSHVMHIVSNVEGELDSERFDELDALAAGFPAGTVSGAPKVRAMEIIDELETVRRSFYGGCVGYFSASGAMDTCIALRTGLVKDGILYVQAGGGVVADSDPEAEYQETVNKAKALVRAAEDAARFVQGHDLD
ncbi:MAG: anthranilate synthase component I [Rhodospirillaceae bacterium]